MDDSIEALKQEASQYAAQALSPSNREWYRRVVSALDQQEAELARLRAEVEKLEAALLWYADPINYETGQDCPDVLIDGGNVARAALAPTGKDNA